MEEAQVAAQEAAKHHREVLANNTVKPHSNVTVASNATVVAKNTTAPAAPATTAAPVANKTK